jgi:hypothetical protein
MKAKTISLDVDFMGGGPPPTSEELRMISEAIKADRERRLRLQSSPKQVHPPLPPNTGS